MQPVEDVVERLERQQHRRVIKTHTPLDGVPLDARATYIVAARHPLDAAVSLYHQGANLDRRRMHELTGAPVPTGPRQPIEQWLAEWIGEDPDPIEELDSLPGVMWHLADAWTRREEPNVVLVHFDDLLTDLEEQMRRLADQVSIDVPAERWDSLVEAATLQQMRSRAHRLAPNPLGILLNPGAFFRSGASGAGAQVLDAATLTRYTQRTADLAPPDLLAWLHRGHPG